MMGVHQFELVENRNALRSVANSSILELATLGFIR